jgi:hypothetical protein
MTLPMKLSTTREGINCEPLHSFPALYGTWKFITTFTRGYHFFLFVARPIQSTLPHTICTRSVLMLSTHLHLGHSRCLSSSGLLKSNFSPIRAKWPTQFILLKLIILITLGEVNKSRSSSFFSFLHPPPPLFCHSSVSTYSLAPCSQGPPV